MRKGTHVIPILWLPRIVANKGTGLDVNNKSGCCENDKYCMIDTSFALQCCAIGSDCSITACDSAHYICPKTVTNSGKATVTVSCCERSCTATSEFKCDAAYGGHCCGYGMICASENKCLPAATASITPVVSQIQSGCTAASQSACPTSVGGGCCDIGLACTVVDNTNYCAASTGMATRTGVNGILATAVPKSSSGLSIGAKAGIGAGVAVVACVAVGIFLWCCLAHRRRSRNDQSVVASGPEMSQGSEAGLRRPPQGRQASDYFGPTAAPGPFTDSPTSPMSGSPGGSRGVPASPQNPGDITTPVEIDSGDHSNVTSPGLFEYSKSGRTASHPVELP